MGFMIILAQDKQLESNYLLEFWRLHEFGEFKEEKKKKEGELIIFMFTFDWAYF